MKKFTMCIAIAALSVSALAQNTDKVTVPFRDQSAPRKLVVDTLNGSITVKGYDGKDAIFDVAGGDVASKGAAPPPGMHRIGGRGAGWEITEENNVIRASSGPFGASNVSIQIPVQTSVSLMSVNGSRIVVENISGEIEVQSTNGSVSITGVSGSVVANSVNGRVVVELDKVTAGKAMSFSTLNGNIDVTLPADTKANLKLKAEQGNMYTDFDVKEDTTPRPNQVEDNQKNGGKYRVRLDRTTYGTINGGGPEIQFTTFNGNIRLHKK